MQEIIAWVIAQGPALLEAIFALFGFLTLVARITPTPKDDEIVSKFGKVLNFLFSKTNTK